MNPKLVLLSIGVLAASGLAFVMVSDEFGRPERPERFEVLPPTIFSPPVGDPHQAEFTFCVGPVRANCVVDGDTFWFEGAKIRIADIDAPEISEPGRSDERQAGEDARRRLLELLNAGAFALRSGWRDEDRYGRKLRVVSRDRRSLGEMLVKEGLARNWDGPRHSWCG